MRRRFLRINLAKPGKLVLTVLVGIPLLLISAAAPLSAVVFPALVYDPTNGATLIASLAKDAAILGQEVQVVENTVNTWKQLVQTHNMLHFTLQMIANKAAWKAYSHYIHPNSTTNTFGETRFWSAAMNSGVVASVAWRNATNTPGNPAWMAAESVGSSIHLSNLATIEMTDGSALDVIDGIGKSRVAQSQTMDAIKKLEGRAESDADTDNTLIGQLNIANGAHIAQLRLMESSATVNTMLLQQQLIANTTQRNLLADASQIYSKVDAVTESKPYAIQGADTFQTFTQP